MNLKEQLKNSESISVAVLDSGFGGYSVAAHIPVLLSERNICGVSEISFVNIRPSIEKGFQDLSGTEERVEVLNKAMYTVNRNLKPDVIIMACNTLSVLLPDTEFIKNKETPVIDIVECAAEMAINYLSENKDNYLLFLATPVTIDSEVYQKMLIEAGITKERFAMQGCEKLATAIDRGESLTPFFDNMFTSWQKILKDNITEAGISLNCTHYGYAENQIKKHFEDNGVKVDKMLNPNPELGSIFINNIPQKKDSSSAALNVKSFAPVSEKTLTAVAKLISPVNLEAAECIKDYKLVPDWKF
ncbi:MAG: aspartate/glutamate racemase family protein [Planctomycetota bacterium]|jgi:glutamate racemase